jgi:excisionase family DNA binding protein
MSDTCECVEAEESDLLTVREVAEMLRVSPMTIYRLVYKGKLPCVRVMRSTRIPRVDAQAYGTPQKG